MPGERFVVGIPDISSDDESHIFGETCQDINGRTIVGGNHYVPGPDSCTVCLCDGGKPKWCQAVLCAAPKDCKSFRIGNSCCEFICLDNKDGRRGNSEMGGEVFWDDTNWVGGDLGLRLVATAVTAILSLALLAFLFYRLRRPRTRSLSGCNEEGDTVPSSSMASYDGDIANSTGHLSRQPPMRNLVENHNPRYLIWKTPGTSNQDSPPPYSENPSGSSNPNDEEHHETTGLLTTPSAPLRTEITEDEITQLTHPPDNVGIHASDLLDAGTPPPSYAEALASISDDFSDPVEVSQNQTQDIQELPAEQCDRFATGNNRPDVAIQRFSMQLAMDCSDTSSCSSSYSQAQPLSSSSSSSANSLTLLS